MVKVKWIALLLIVLIAASLLLRLEGVRRDHRHTFDETLYPYLAYRLNGGLSNYNAVQIYAESLKDALPLPSYLSAPLFKHPPLFPYLIRTYFYTFGHTMQSAELVSVHAGCALILIAYLLGATLYNRKIGLIAALLVAIDPIAWICSEKIWLAMTLALFTNLGLLFFWMGCKKGNIYFLASGAAIGLAAYTKYPGVLALVIIACFAIIYRRDLFKNIYFYLLFIISALFMFPWIITNIKFYGSGFLRQMLLGHSYMSAPLDRLTNDLSTLVKILMSLGSVIFVIVAWSIIRFYNKREVISRSARYAPILLVSIPFLYLAFFTSVPRAFFNALNLGHIPFTTWQMGVLAKEPWHFYLNRLLELSPFYIFAFFSFFLLAKKREEDGFLLLTVFIILLSYIVWGNYQSRYILAAVPALLILASRTFFMLYEVIGNMRSTKLIYLLRGMAWGIFLFFLIKTIVVDLAIAVPNSVAYF